MAAIVGDLAVRIGANTEPLNKGLKKASRALDQFGKDIKSQTKDIAKYAAAVTAAGAALGTMAFMSAKAGKEISNMARVSNTSSNEFQKIAVAARTVGIEQEKLADIFKDMNDRVADFIHTGGGPMLDFFEQIAPRVGVTAEQFRKLSGPQALQLYVDSLQKANLSQQEMTFFMEAIASDSTALLPLLKDGGEALRLQAEQAEKLGLALSNVDVERLKNLGVAMSDAGDVFKSFNDELTANFEPVLTAGLDAFKDFVVEMGGVGTIAETAFNNIISGVSFAMNAVEGIQRAFEIVGKSLALLGLGATETGLSIVEWIANRPIQAINELIEAYNAIPFLDDAEPVALTGFGESVKTMLDETRVAIEIGTADLKEAIMRPFTAGEEFEMFVAKAQETSDKVAQIAADARQKELDDKLTHDADILAAVTEAGTWYTEFERDQANKRLEIAKAEAEAKKQALGDALTDLSSLMGTESRKMFEIGKAAAIANTTISTFESAQKSYDALAGIPVVGPALGTAAAAAALAGGFAKVQKIRSQSFRGGGSSGAGASGGTAGVPSAAGNVGSGGQVQPTQNTFIRTIGSGEFVRTDDLFEAINTGLDNGNTIAGISRQS